MLFFLLLMFGVFLASTEERTQVELDHPWIPENAVAVSPNGRYLAIGSSSEGKIWIADLWHRPVTIQEIDSIYAVMSLQFTPDAQYLLAGGADSLIHAWRAGKWQRLKSTLKLPFRSIETLAAKPTSSTFVCGSGKREATELVFFRFEPDELPCFEKTFLLSTEDLCEYPLRLAYTPDGEKLILEGYMGDLLSIAFPDSTTYTKTSIYSKTSYGLAGLSISLDSRYLAFSPLTQDLILIYDFKTNRIIEQKKIAESCPLAFSSNGKFLFSVLNENRLLYWKTKGWQLVDSVTIPELQVIQIIKAVPYSNLLVVMGFSDLLIWDYRQKKVIARYTLK